MKSEIGIIGMGKLGKQMASVLKKNNKNQLLLSKKPYNNQKIVEKCELILLIVQPNKVDSIIKEIEPYLTNKKILVNFTTKRIRLKTPLISVATSPVINKRIEIMFYNKNTKVSKNQLNKFTKIFKPVVNNFDKCEDPVKELGTMSRIYSHILNYYQHLNNESIENKKLNAYFNLALNTTKETKNLNKAISMAKTKSGLTQEIFNYYNKSKFSKFVRGEKETVNKKIKSIQKD